MQPVLGTMYMCGLIDDTEKAADTHASPMMDSRHGLGLSYRAEILTGIRRKLGIKA